MMAAQQSDTALDLDNEERLPWLEPAADFDDDEAVSPVRLLALVLAGLALIGAVLGGLWWWQGGGSRGTSELIAAPAGPYKVPPADDGAKEFEGEGDASFAASEGVETSGRVDPARMPEEPAVTDVPKAAVPAVTQASPPAPAAKSAAPAAKAPVVASKAPPPAPVKPAAKAPSGAPPPPAGTAIQLGAFSSEGSAAKAWTSLTTRFAYLEGLGRSVVPATVGGKTVYRLRAAAGSAAAASDICAKLRVAGESCTVVR